MKILGGMDQRSEERAKLARANRARESTGTIVDSAQETLRRRPASPEKMT